MTSIIQYVRYLTGRFMERVYANRTNEHIFSTNRKPCYICRHPTHWIHLDFSVRLHTYPRPCTMILWRRYMATRTLGKHAIERKKGPRI